MMLVFRELLVHRLENLRKLRVKEILPISAPRALFKNRGRNFKIFFSMFLRSVFMIIIYMQNEDVVF